MDPVALGTLTASLFTKALVADRTQGDAVADLVRERLTNDPSHAPTLAEVEHEPDNPQRKQRLRDALVDVIVMDDVFASKLERLVADAKPRAAEVSGSDGESTRTGLARTRTSNPVRGFPGLTVAATSPQITAGSDFSIFVLVQNPFDVPMTIHQVQTHIPVELIDVNRLRVKLSKGPAPPPDGTRERALMRLWRLFRWRRQLRREHPGVAIAVGTEFVPEEAAELFKSQVIIGTLSESTATISALSFHLPPNASSDDLDAMMRRVVDYQRGVMPVQLQPGDSVVRQFVLRTHSRLLFHPLSHTFQIQINYSVDGTDHTEGNDPLSAQHPGGPRLDRLGCRARGGPRHPGQGSHA